MTAAKDTPNHWPYPNPLYEPKTGVINLPHEATELEMAALVEFCLDSGDLFGQSFGERAFLLLRLSALVSWASFFTPSRGLVLAALSFFHEVYKRLYRETILYVL